MSRHSVSVHQRDQLWQALQVAGVVDDSGAEHHGTRIRTLPNKLHRISGLGRVLRA